MVLGRDVSHLEASRDTEALPLRVDFRANSSGGLRLTVFLLRVKKCEGMCGGCFIVFVGSKRRS